MAISLVVSWNIVQNADPIEGVTVFSRQPRGHAPDPVASTANGLPPVGGIHHSQPQDCGIYRLPIANERAIHSMEHGAVWITYRPDLPEVDVSYLENFVRNRSFLLLSPFPDLRSPVVLTAWGVQLEVQSVSDKRIQHFISRYMLGPLTPERGAMCPIRDLALAP